MITKHYTMLKRAGTTTSAMKNGRLTLMMEMIQADLTSADMMRITFINNIIYIIRFSVFI